MYAPRYVLSEHDGDDASYLNDFVNNKVSSFIHEIIVKSDRFTLSANQESEEFLVRVFKLYSPRNQKSRISLVAHKREVSGSVLQNYIPEFEDQFYEKDRGMEDGPERNYIIKAYVFGSYLDRNVSLERGDFEFAMDSELILGIAQVDIEKSAATVAREAVGSDILLRQDKKRERVQSYVDEEAPWHKSILSTVSLSEMSCNPTFEEIEACLQSEKFAHERSIKSSVAKLLSETNMEEIKESVA